MGSFGILVGGGPAPGINGVIGAAATTAIQNGHEVVGILSGFKWLMEGREIARSRKHVRPLALSHNRVSCGRRSPRDRMAACRSISNSSARCR